MFYVGKCETEKEKKNPTNFLLNKHKTATEYSNMGGQNDQSGTLPCLTNTIG